MNKKILPCVVFLGLINVFPLSATQKTKVTSKKQASLAPHVHGEAKLRFVVESDKKSIQVTLNVPAINVLGFEHKPKTENEKKSFDETHANLLSPEKLFLLMSKNNERADCSFKDSKLKIPFLEEKGSKAHVHKHSDDEADSHEDFILEYFMTCKNTSVLKGVRLTGLSWLKDIEKVKVEGFFDGIPQNGELNSKQTDFIFSNE